jgi:peptide chain release factor subunit 1
MCDSKFHLDDVLEMYDDSVNYGIVLLSGKEYRCYILEVMGKNKNFKLVNSDTIQLQKHQKKGGQSAVRFDRNRVIQRNQYNKDVSEVIRESYMRSNNTKCLIKGLIVGGVGDIKKEIMDQVLFEQYFSGLVLKVVNTDGINDGTVYDVYNKSLDVLSEFDMVKVNSVMEEIGMMIMHADDKLVFGQVEVIKELKDNGLKKVIISDENNDEKLHEMIKLIDYVIVPNTLVIKYGGIVGIKYYAVNNDNKEFEYEGNNKEDIFI